MNPISLNTKQVGYVLIAVSVLLGLVVWQYTNAINARNVLLHEDCNLPDNICPFKQSFPTESVLGMVLSAFIFLFGLFLIYTYRDVNVMAKEKRSKQDQIVKTLEGDEQKVYNAVVEADGAIYQHDLITKLGMSKVKMTRILDFLEARGLLERKRRGMSNLVILKNF